jgi:hypothetical protein
VTRCRSGRKMLRQMQRRLWHDPERGGSTRFVEQEPV